MARKKNAVSRAADTIETVTNVVSFVGKVAGVVAGAAGAVSTVAEKVEDVGDSVNKAVVKPVKRALGISKTKPAKKAGTKKGTSRKAGARKK
jgi:hypothetical protein